VDSDAITIERTSFRIRPNNLDFVVDWSTESCQSEWVHTADSRSAALAVLREALLRGEVRRADEARHPDSGPLMVTRLVNRATCGDKHSEVIIRRDQSEELWQWTTELNGKVVRVVGGSFHFDVPAQALYYLTNVDGDAQVCSGYPNIPDEMAARYTLPIMRFVLRSSLPERAPRSAELIALNRPLTGISVGIICDLDCGDVPDCPKGVFRVLRSIDEIESLDLPTSIEEVP
jgi:hypothetical protein